MSDEEATEETGDPFSDLTVGMIELHEMFIGMVKTGFSEHQACLIIGTMLGTMNSDDK